MQRLFCLWGVRSKLLEEFAEAVSALLIIFEHIHAGAGGGKHDAVALFRHFNCRAEDFGKVCFAADAVCFIFEVGMDFCGTFTVKNSCA